MRLVSAALWKVLKQRDVLQYGVVEEFVTSACEAVPGLLTVRHQGKLAVGLRARVSVTEEGKLVRWVTIMMIVKSNIIPVRIMTLHIAGSTHSFTHTFRLYIGETKHGLLNDRNMMVALTEDCGGVWRWELFLVDF